VVDAGIDAACDAVSRPDTLMTYPVAATTTVTIQ
jgi:hypothetical protein